MQGIADGEHVVDDLFGFFFFFNEMGAIKMTQWAMMLPSSLVT